MVDGSVKFVSRNKRGVEACLELPCGQCIGCRLERSRQWAMRCLHEASLHENNAFITLTYDDSNLPRGGSLDYSDFQKFMKRLRKRIGRKVSFYCGGEYGDTHSISVDTFRPEPNGQNGNGNGNYRGNGNFNQYGGNYESDPFNRV